MKTNGFSTYVNRLVIFCKHRDRSINVLKNMIPFKKTKMTFDLYTSTYQETANYHNIIYSFKSYIFIFLRTVCNNEDI